MVCIYSSRDADTVMSALQASPREPRRRKPPGFRKVELVLEPGLRRLEWEGRLDAKSSNSGTIGGRDSEVLLEGHHH
jgi:hypothetical protein